MSSLIELYTSAHPEKILKKQEHGCITMKYKMNLGIVRSLQSNSAENLPRPVQKTTDHPVTSQTGTTRS